LIVPASGSFDVVFRDGKKSKIINLKRPYCGLFISGVIWTVPNFFSAGSICLVFASERFEEENYIRDYDEFLRIKGISTESK